MTQLETYSGFEQLNISDLLSKSFIGNQNFFIAQKVYVVK